MSHWRRLGGAMVALVLVLVVGTIGYLALGFGLLDALYQTVTTVSTVGFREVEPLSPAGQVFTMVLILFGVGAALYAFSVLIKPSSKDASTNCSGDAAWNSRSPRCTTCSSCAP